MTDTTTLKGRVRYVLEKDELARRNDGHLALMVWKTFYRHLLIDPDAAPKIDLLDLFYIPSLPRILAAKKSLEEKKPEPEVNWYSKAP